MGGGRLEGCGGDLETGGGGGRLGNWRGVGRD